MTDVYVCGLATDYCVKFTALDARQLGFKTHLIEDACRGVNLKPGDVDAGDRGDAGGGGGGGQKCRPGDAPSENRP